MKKALLMVFILTILISCKSEEKLNTINVTHTDAARTSSTITLTNKSELPRIEPTIDLFFPIEQSTYQIRFISFLKDNENNYWISLSKGGILLFNSAGQLQKKFIKEDFEAKRRGRVVKTSYFKPSEHNSRGKEG